MGLFDRFSGWISDFFSRGDEASDPVKDTAQAAYDALEDNFGVPEERDTSWADDVRGAPEGFDDFVSENGLLDPGEWDSMVVHIESGGGHIEYSVNDETYVTDFLDKQELWTWAEYISDQYDLDYGKEIDS